MAATLYGMAISHPSQAAHKMLQHKGIEHKIVSVPPTMQALAVHLAGFDGGTVPALKLDGRRIQGSIAIAHALEELQPDPPLYPRDPEQRRRVEEAERWGNDELQPVPRRIFRWGGANVPDVRRWVAATTVPAALAGPLGTLSAPATRVLARKSGATEEGVRLTLERLPGRLDHVDALIAEGTIGGPEPNAADYQIASTVRVLSSFRDIRPALEGRPASELGERLFPRLAGDFPPFLPPEWLAPLRG